MDELKSESQKSSANQQSQERRNYSLCGDELGFDGSTGDPWSNGARVPLKRIQDTIYLDFLKSFMGL